MPVKEIGDPRLQALFGADDPREAGVRPVVRLPGKGVPPAAIAVGALLLALLLFSALNSRRTYTAEPRVQPGASDNGASAWAAPPPLYVPPVPQPAIAPPLPEQAPRPAPAPTAAPPVRTAVVPAPVVQPVPQFIPAPVAPAPPPQRVATGSPLVIDTGAGPATATAGSNLPGVARSDGGSAPHAPVRVRASTFANRSMTVPQGYLIPAVLETGFDSTKPGYARAIVSRDVRGFDGKYVLIPRGSRLTGEYQSAARQGQNRAVIAWTRLIRPDGMTIEMDSPAVDPVGRGGVAASVNTHFFARLGDALLQTAFQFGQAFAGRSVTGPVVVLPGNGTAAAPQQLVPTPNYTPTLKVPPGKSISIFVAQDLDFTAAGGGR
jgi:type IV secretion system protein VirB10